MVFVFPAPNTRFLTFNDGSTLMQSEALRNRIRLSAFLACAFILAGTGRFLYAGNQVVTSGQSIQSSLASLQPGDTLFVRAGTYVESLSFPNAGRAGSPIVLMAWPGERPVIKSSGDRLLTLNKDYLVVDGFILDHGNKSSDAIRIRGNAKGCVIRNNEIRNGRRDAIEVNSGSDHLIENNIIHDFVWQRGKDAHGIVTDPGVLRLTIRNNTIYDVGGDCIQLYASGSDPVSSYSRDITIKGNIFYTTLGNNSENALDFKGVDGALVADNEMYGFANKAVVVQKGCRNIILERNIIRDSDRGIEFRGENGKGQENITVRYNVIYNIANYFAVKFDWVDNVTFVHNTIANVTTRPFFVEEEGITNGVIKNNLFYNSEAPRIKGTFEAVFSHNGWFQTSPGPLAGANDVSGNDPGFVDAGAENFALKASSPARDAGTDVGLPYVGSAPDLGANEYGGQTTAVELISFSARQDEDANVVLSWETSGTGKTIGFAIQRRKHNEMEFRTVGAVPVLPSDQGRRSWSFTDENVAPGRYFYRLVQTDADGTVTKMDPVQVVVTMPQRYGLEQNWPNPFSVSGAQPTKFTISLPQETFVQVRVYNLLGQEMKQLFFGRLPGGKHVISWDGKDRSGKPVAPGIYFYELRANSIKHVRSLVAIR